MIKTKIESLNVVIPNLLIDTKSDDVVKEWKYLSLLIARSQKKEFKTTAFEYAMRLLGLENLESVAAIKLRLMDYSLEDNWVCMAELANMQPNRDHVTIVDSQFPDLTEQEADIILNDLNNYFVDDRFTFHKLSLSEWVCVLPRQISAPIVSANEIAGKNILDFIPEWRTNLFFKKFLSDAQMILHHSRGNLLRSKLGKREINSIWLHGVGRLPQEINSQIDVVISDCITLRSVAEFAVVDKVESIQKGLDLDSISGKNILLYQSAGSDAIKIDPTLFETIFNRLKNKTLGHVNLIVDSQFIFTLTPRDARKFWKRKFRLK